LTALCRHSELEETLHWTTAMIYCSKKMTVVSVLITAATVTSTKKRVDFAVEEEAVSL